MKKRWIGLVVSALLSAGCAPQVIETPGGAVECYSKKCVNEATTWTRQHNSQMAKVEREEQKRQEKAAQEAKDLQENPWRTFSVAQVTQIAKQNQIALFQITRKNNQITEVAGIDLRSLESGVNVYGHSIAKGRLVGAPTPVVLPRANPEIGAICQGAGGLVYPNGQIVALQNLMYSDKKVWGILCSRGATIPEPTVHDLAPKPASPAGNTTPTEATI